MFQRSLFLLFIAWILLSPCLSQAQRWKRYRHEVYAGIGGSNFLGELGGGEEAGKDFIDDLDYNMTRPTFAIGYRYKIWESLSARANLIYGRLNGSDENTTEIFRRNRNLHFRSPVIELSGQLEVYFIRESTSNRYRLRGIKGKLRSNLSAYFFGGFGGFYFNPKAQVNGTGKWHALQPLGTEGQGLKPDTKKYSRISMAIPMGIGLKYNLNKQWSLGLEYGLRKTFTDYIDDVSTQYYDNAEIRNNYGDIAADLADPSLNIVTPGDDSYVTAPGEQRGDSRDKDSYMFAILSLHYRFIQSKSNRPKF